MLLFDFAQACNRHRKRCVHGAITLSFLPLAALGIRTATNRLGPNPYETLMAESGLWSMILLIVTLLITPLRRWLTWLCQGCRAPYGKRLADWNFLILCRKSIGNACLCYAVIHALVYLHFDLLWFWRELWLDVRERPFIAAGVVTLLGLLLLGLSSPKAVQKRLGRHWRRLHRSIYVIAVLAVVHTLLEAKPTDLQPWWYAALIAVLLLHRLLVSVYTKLRNIADDGMPASRRS